jgi:hypothetical protein
MFCLPLMLSEKSKEINRKGHNVRKELMINHLLHCDLCDNLVFIVVSKLYRQPHRLNPNSTSKWQKAPDQRNKKDNGIASRRRDRNKRI